jgi:uncharacterized protein YbjT (DUF2867 family)
MTSPPSPPRVFVAGATGAVGTVFLPKARAAGLRVRPHVRPQTAERHPLGQDPEAQIFDLTDAGRLQAAVAEVDAVVCLVGTTRARFDAGDTYESSDYRPVVDLVAAARQPPAGRHFVLLSSLGAREGMGYLGWKWRAEEAVRQSGLDWTILRPSFFDSQATLASPSDGRPRRPPPLVGGTLRALGHLPGLRGMADDLRPISLDVLAQALVRLVRDRGPVGAVLTGRQIWALGGELQGPGARD